MTLAYLSPTFTIRILTTRDCTGVRRSPRERLKDNCGPIVPQRPRLVQQLGNSTGIMMQSAQLICPAAALNAAGYPAVVQAEYVLLPLHELS